MNNKHIKPKEITIIDMSDQQRAFTTIVESLRRHDSETKIRILKAVIILCDLPLNLK